MKTVRFYFDFLSPFAYLASEEIEVLCDNNGAQAVFKPVLFPGLLNHWGQRGPAEIPPKAAHTLRQCLRYAHHRGVPLRSPKYHPFRPLTALRACLATEDCQRATAVHALFRHGWAVGGDLGSDGAIAAALTRAGLDGTALVKAAGQRVFKAKLKAETEAAIAEGVFGIPTMIVDDELFWGLDQLPYVALHLQGRDPIAGIDLAERMPIGVGAWRPGVSHHGGGRGSAP